MVSVLRQSCPLLLQTYSRCALYRISHFSSTATEVPREVAAEIEADDVDAVRPTGWSPPRAVPAPPGVEPDIPFRVRRSKNNMLPVYTDYKNGRTRILTKISKIDGDIVRMEEMLREHLQVDNLRCKVDAVTGSIVLNGNYRTQVRIWLKSLGF